MRTAFRQSVPIIGKHPADGFFNGLGNFLIAVTVINQHIGYGSVHKTFKGSVQIAARQAFSIGGISGQRFFLWGCDRRPGQLVKYQLSRLLVVHMACDMKLPQNVILIAPFNLIAIQPDRFYDFISFVKV